MNSLDFHFFNGIMYTFLYFFTHFFMVRGEGCKTGDEKSH